MEQMDAHPLALRLAELSNDPIAARELQESARTFELDEPEVR